MDIEITEDIPEDMEMSESLAPATTSVGVYPMGCGVLENEDDNETLGPIPDGSPFTHQHAPLSNILAPSSDSEALAPIPDGLSLTPSDIVASSPTPASNVPDIPDPSTAPSSSNVANFADVPTSSDAPEDTSDTAGTPDTVTIQGVHAKRRPGPLDADSDVARFFDLEAQVDSDNEDYESEPDDDDFINDQETISSHSPGPNVVAEIATHSAFLEHLEETYLIREPSRSLSPLEPPTNFTQLERIRLNNAEDWIGQKIRRSVQRDDWKLYRVKCAPNTEVDVIHYLLTEKDLRNELRAAFYNHDIIGTIYLEARFSRHPVHGKSLLDTLSGLVDVRLSTLCAVPECDYSSSLSPTSSLSHPFYSTGDWVTVGRGLYKGDVGLVMGYVETMETGKHNVGVLLVPRLVMNFDADKDEFEHTRSLRKQKRKRLPARPRPVLFTLEKCGPRSAELVTRVPSDEARTEHDYKHRTLGYFSHGLTLRYYTPSSLTPAVAISHELINLFVKSKHPILARAPLLQPDIWQFLPGEKVSSSEFGGGITGTIKAVTERGCEVECEEGFYHVPSLQLRKVIHPGDFVRVLHGTHENITGLVGAVTVRLVGLITEYGKTISHWVDINTVTLTDSSRLVHNFPWKNVQVRILRGLFQGMKAVIKNVWPDGHGSLQVSVFVPAIHHSCEVDYTELVEYSSQKTLPAFAPIPGYLSHFIPNRDLEAMKTGKKPWIGARVNVVSGPWKGYRGVVRDVNVYRLSPEQVVRGASGVKLLIELNVVTPTVTNPRHHIDYDHVREASQEQFLAHAIRPTERQSFFMPSSSYIPSKPESTSQIMQTVHVRSGTPEPDEVARSFTFTGLWHPQWDSANSHDQQRDSIFRPPPDYFRSVAQGGSDIPVPDPHNNLWIFHPKLVGIPIEVDLRGRKGTHYVKVVPRQGGGFMVIEERRKGEEPLVVWTPDVARSQDRPKPKTEKSLMVIVKGSEEHIGKLVRRIHHFYKGNKSDNNMWFILGVVEFVAETGEILTSERLENHPDDLEKVQETRDVRKYSALVMAAARDEFRFSSPEIRY